MIRVALCDDHRIFREGLSALIGDEPGMSVVGEAGDGREAVKMCRKITPHVLVLDISMPGMNGVEACGRVRDVAPATRVIALSMHTDARFVSAMLRAGAAGYLLKECASQEVLRAVHTVAGGETYLCPPIASTVVEDYVRRGPTQTDSAFQTLTKREREVLQLLAEGQNLAQIAEQLHLSVKTIHTHRVRMTDKLGLESVAQLTKYAVREGLTEL